MRSRNDSFKRENQQVSGGLKYIRLVELTNLIGGNRGWRHREKESCTTV